MSIAPFTVNGVLFVMGVHMRVAKYLDAAVDRYAGHTDTDDEIGPVRSGEKHYDTRYDNSAVRNEIIQAERGGRT